MMDNHVNVLMNAMNYTEFIFALSLLKKTRIIFKVNLPFHGNLV